MQENMDVYKSQQIAKLRERCKNQVRIRKFHRYISCANPDPFFLILR